MGNLYGFQLYTFNELTQMGSSIFRSTADELCEVFWLRAHFVSLKNLYVKDCICLALWVEDEISLCLCSLLSDCLWSISDLCLMIIQQWQCFLSLLPLWRGFLDWGKILILIISPQHSAGRCVHFPSPSSCLVMLAEAAATILADLVGDLVDGKHPRMAKMLRKKLGGTLLSPWWPWSHYTALNCLSLEFFYVKEK